MAIEPSAGTKFGGVHENIDDVGDGSNCGKSEHQRRMCSCRDNSRA